MFKINTFLESKRIIFVSYIKRNTNKTTATNDIIYCNFSLPIKRFIIIAIKTKNRVRLV